MRVLAAVLLSWCASAAFAQTHPCEADAMARAGALLKLHWNSDGTALADSARAARQVAYEAIHGIRFDGMQYRKDIAHRAIRPVGDSTKAAR